MTDWGPVIIVAVLSSDMLHLSLIIATALSVGNMTVDLLFKTGGYIKVRSCSDIRIAVLNTTVASAYQRRKLHLCCPATAQTAREVIGDLFFRCMAGMESGRFDPHFLRIGHSTQMY